MAEATLYDFLIVGAGPAGLQAAYFLQKQSASLNIKYLVLERAASAGAFFDIFPRSNKLISINKVYTGTDDPEFNMRHDWNSLLSDGDDPELLFKHFTEDLFPHRKYLPEYLQHFAQKTHLNIRYNTEVKNIARADNKFVITDATGNMYKSNILFMCTGTFEQHIPKIPGIEKAWLYSNCPLDKEYWKNKRVLILGKGNSAFETADDLSPFCATIHCASPRPVQLAWDTHYVGDLRAVNNNYLDLYQLKSQHGMISGRCVNLEWAPGNEDKKIGQGVTASYAFTVSPDDPVTKFKYDEVIVAAGWRYINSQLFDETCKVVTSHAGKFSALGPLWESVSVPNLFFSGAAMQGREFKKFTTGFIHGFRYCIRTQMNYLFNREYGVPLPSLPVKNDAAALAQYIVSRVNSCSAPYQMFQILVDAIILHPGWKSAPELEYRLELPSLYLQKASDLKNIPYIEVMLQYGDRGGVAAFMFEQQSVPGKADLGWALHPCLRLYYNGRVLFRHHMLETAELNWDIPELHTEPLREWLEMVFKVLETADLDSLPEVKPDEPLAKQEITYRGSEGEEMKTKRGEYVTKMEMGLLKESYLL